MQIKALNSNQNKSLGGRKIPMKAPITFLFIFLSFQDSREARLEVRWGKYHLKVPNYRPLIKWLRLGLNYRIRVII